MENIPEQKFQKLSDEIQKDENILKERTSAQFLQNLHNNNQLITKEYQNEIIGCIALFSTFNPNLFEIGSFRTSNFWRNQGIGTELWNQLMERVKDEEFGLVYFSKNPIVIKKLIKVGFVDNSDNFHELIESNQTKESKELKDLKKLDPIIQSMYLSQKEIEKLAFFKLLSQKDPFLVKNERCFVRRRG